MRDPTTLSHTSAPRLPPTPVQPPTFLLPRDPCPVSPLPSLHQPLHPESRGSERGFGPASLHQMRVDWHPDLRYIRIQEGRTLLARPRAGLMHMQTGL